MIFNCGGTVVASSTASGAIIDAEHDDRCEPKTYAYVVASDKNHNIYLCPLFFKSPPKEAMDSQPGTIIHELTHFKDVMGTTDGAYGASGTKALAEQNPPAARNNADNVNGYEDEMAIQNSPAMRGMHVVHLVCTCPLVERQFGRIVQGGACGRRVSCWIADC